MVGRLVCTLEWIMLGSCFQGLSSALGSYVVYPGDLESVLGMQAFQTYLVKWQRNFWGVIRWGKRTEGPRGTLTSALLSVIYFSV